MTASVQQGVSLLRIGKMKFSERSERTFSLIDDQLGGSFIDVRTRLLESSSQPHAKAYPFQLRKNIAQ